MAQPVKNILIVGGGTAGWMAATYLAAQLGASGGRVTLVESPAIPTIGVGEATVPPLVGFLRVLGISEDDFMRKSHATYKLGIKFAGWHDRSADDAYWHPFGPVGGNIDGMPLFHFWLKSRRAGHDAGAYTSYSLQALLAEQEKAPRAVAVSTPLYDRGQYAYHLDAGAFAGFLKGEALKRGAHHVADEVTEVVVGERGHIHSVVTRQHGALRADLYIDCSGFRALLAEQALGDPYIDWSDSLLCDRALAAPLPLGPRTPPYTRATALSAGWVWQIPLTHRVGNGYVFSSKFIGEQAAGRELAARLGVGLDELEPRLLKMKVGRRTRCWQGNCIAMGLASGFVEPIESTGIFVIQRALALLLTYFPDLDFEPHLARRYNERMARTYDEIRDFILAHYVLTRRDDSAFWNACRGLALPDSLRELLEVYDRTGLVEPVEHAMFPAPSWYCILAGQRRLPSGAHAGAELSGFTQVRAILDSIREQNARLAQTLPGHRDYIEMLNRGDPARRALQTAKATDTAATGGIG
jgi:tryptophan 7-halogenase